MCFERALTEFSRIFLQPCQWTLKFHCLSKIPLFWSIESMSIKKLKPWKNLLGKVGKLKNWKLINSHLVVCRDEWLSWSPSSLSSSISSTRSQPILQKVISNLFVYVSLFFNVIISLLLSLEDHKVYWILHQFIVKVAK